MYNPRVGKFCLLSESLTLWELDTAAPEAHTKKPNRPIAVLAANTVVMYLGSAKFRYERVMTMDARVGYIWCNPNVARQSHFIELDGSEKELAWALALPKKVKKVRS